MYKLRHVNKDRWSVLDADDVPVFEGTLRECEDWLDHRENLAANRPSLLHRICRWVARFCRGCRAGAPEEQSQTEPPAENPEAGTQSAQQEDGTAGANHSSTETSSPPINSG